jgi:phosphoglycerol transferase MdoB-like AlkP superfamily enzyme
MAGFDTYFGRSQYDRKGHDDGNWGIYDEHFLDFFARKMDGFKPPFTSVFFSLSSHHPYTLPAEYKNSFKGGTLPVHATIRYADHSLKKFFEGIKSKPWYRNTLFVITADHSTYGEVPYYQNHVGMFSVPLIFYCPGRGLKGESFREVQQTDIMPSVLHYMNYDQKFLAFGNSAFDTTASRFAMNYVSGFYQIFSNGHALQFDGEKILAAYRYEKDSLLHDDLKGKRLGVLDSLMNLSKAVIQSYNARLIQNKLTGK